MQPNAYPVNLQQLKGIWHHFVETGRLRAEDKARIDLPIRKSWQRCLPRLDYGSPPRPKRLAASSLSSVLSAQSNLIAVASPVMEDVYQFIEGSQSAVLLADASTCMLNVVGDPQTVAVIEELQLGQGTYWSEEELGTNALGLVRITAMPIQVVGPEHYYEAHHAFVSTAAPIHDVRGRLIGILAIANPVAEATSHTLGLVMTAARAVGNQLHTDWFIEEANRHLTEVNAVLEAITVGVVAWNEDGIIHHANEPASDLLGLRPAALVGKQLAQVLPLPKIVKKAMAAGKTLQDIETGIQVNGQATTFLLNLRPVRQGDQQPAGYIAMLRPMEQVRELVHQQIGAQATLHLDDIVSQSPAMRPVLRQARVAARGTAPVLVRGEGGAGKNHLARAIHNDGPRPDSPFIAVNCQAIPHELMVGELLGRAKESGSQSRPSKFELAEGGTLLLDQVEHLSLEMQAALLHLIETGYVLRPGSPEPIPVEVRIIAATTANLEERLADNSFLSHLYYRFGVFNITIPPLRERVEDIPLLAERFLARITQRSDRASWIEDEAMAILCRYPWPGNVRELESVLERALRLSVDDTIHVADLPPTVRQGRIMREGRAQAQPVLSMEEAEREAIIRAGRACQGRVTAMAEQLQIGRTTLWRKMKQFELDPDIFK